MKNTKHHLDVHIKQLPPALAATLRQATRRIRRILFLRGLLAVAATALIALLIIMAVDAAVVIYNPVIRWGLSLAGLAAVLWVAGRVLVRPLTQRFSPSRIAALIEQRHPELEERLSTVVELMAMPETYGRGSEQLVSLITEAAEADARQVTPKQEFTGRTVKPKLIAAAVATMILGALFAAFPHHAALLALRALAPFAEIDNVFAKNLTVAPGSAIVLLGEPLEVELAVMNTFSGQPYLRRQFTKGRLWGRELSERMRQVPSDGDTVRQYRQLFPSVEQSFRYRVGCGHALTRRYTVTAVPRPAAEIGSVHYAYPAYTGKPSVTETNIPGGIAAPVGTRVTFVADLNRPDIFGTFSLPPQEWAIASNAAQQATCEFTLTKGMDTRLDILLRDGYGFTNHPSTYTVRAIPDRPPTISFVRPDKATVRLSRRTQLAIDYQMIDDYGVTNAILHISRNDEPFTQHAALSHFEKTDEETWMGTASLNLNALNLDNVSKLRIQLSVEDTLPRDLDGPQTARSNIVTIELDDGARALEIQQYQESIKKLEEALRKIIEQMKQTERSAEDIRSALDRKEQPNQQTQQKLDRIRQELAMEEHQMQKLAEEHQDSALKDLAEKLEQLRQEQLEAARKAAEEAQLAALEEQPLKVRDLEKRLEDSIRSTEDMLKEARDFNRQLDRLAALDELSMREQTLADTAEQAKTQEAMNDWRQKQEELRNNFHQQVAENQEARLDAMEARKERLDNLAEEVKALSNEQQQLREQTAQEQTGTPERTEQQQALAEKLAEARQEMDDIRQDMYRVGPQPTHQPLEQANNSLRQAQQQAKDASRDLQQSQENKNADQQRNKHDEAVRRQQEAKNQIDNASRAIEQAQQEMERAIENQRQKIAEQNPFKDADMAQLNQSRDALKALSEEAQQLATEQSQLSQAQRQETAEKQQAEREQRPFTPSEDTPQRTQQQQQIAQQAKALDQQVESMRNEMQKLGDVAKPLQQPLQEAKNELDYAQRLANDAAQTLQNQPRQPHESLWRQEDAQRGIEKAAASLMQAERRLDQLLENAAQQTPPQGQPPDAPPPSMDASDHMREAMRDAAQAQKTAEQERRAQENPAAQQPPPTPSSEHMQSAEQNAQTAADQMRQMVQQQAQRLNVPLEHLPSRAMTSAMPSPKPQPRPRLELPIQMPAMLREQQLPDSEWFRLRGEISSQAMDDALRKVSPEYRELVRMYFRELSKQNQ